MTSIAKSTTYDQDAQLVEQCRAGDQAAFGEIVTRYQSLVCGLAYSATGSRTHSEDLAQEVFVTAWRSLRDLREPTRLRAWLCGIARNIINGDLRRLGRQPAHDAASLDSIGELPEAHSQPTETVISNEEMMLLWREIEGLPDSYREPLVLYYREHRSVDKVAAALGLTPDTVLQRLSRGRRLLQERMLAFIETTLERSNPGPQFRLQIMAALPALAGGSSAMALSTASKGGAAAKTGLFGIFLTWAAPLVGVFAAIGVSWAEIAQAQSVPERKFAARWLLLMWLNVVALVVGISWVVSQTHDAADRGDIAAPILPLVAVWSGFAMIAVTLVVLMNRRKAVLRRTLVAQGAVPSSPARPPSFRQRSLTVFAVLISLFWVLIFLAWQTGDRRVALAIVAGLVVWGGLPLWFGRRHPATAEAEQKAGAWFVAASGLLFLAVLNARLGVWLAGLYGVSGDRMQQLLPMAIIHWLSAVLIGWTVLLLLLTRPRRSR